MRASGTHTSKGRLARARLFGGLALEDVAGRPIVVPSSRARSLLAYLLLEPGTAHPRERVADALWPALPADRASRILNDALYRLRQAVGPDAVLADRTAVRLASDPGGPWVDAWAFEDLLADRGPGSLREALNLYRGELLPEVFDDWIVARREALADAYRMGLATLAADAERAGAEAEALQAYHRLTAADPLDEAGHRGLIRAYHRAGQPAAARQQYERLVSLLASELGIEPSAETRRLVETPAGDLTAEPAPARPFVGRVGERAAILARIDGAIRGRPVLVLVEGEPGIGKSRLLETIADDARWRGFTVAAGRADEAGRGTPYGPMDAALASVVSPAAFERLRGHLDPAALHAVATVLPHLAEGGMGLAIQRPGLATALSALFRELTTAEPWALVLDDVHDAGPAFWDAMRFVADADDMRLVVILGYRSSEARSAGVAWDGLRRLDADLAPLRVRLAGLSLADSRALADAIGRPASDADLAAIHRISAGNPLFLQQALAAEGSAQASVGSPVPGFAALVDRRLASLSQRALRAAEGAAVLGSEFAFGEWLAVVPDEPPAAFREVIDARLVLELRDRYVFEHDLTRAHMHDSIEPGRRAELHGRAADVVRRERGSPAVLAWHLEEAGQPGAAAREQQRAAEDAFRRYAYRDALEHVDRAIDLAAGIGTSSTAPDEASLMPLLTLRHRVLGLLLRVDAWREALDAAEGLAIRLGDDLALIEVLEGRLSLSTLDGDLDRMEVTAARALALSRAAGDVASEARVLASFGWHVNESLGDNRRALPMLRRAARIADEVGDGVTRVAALCSMSSALRSMGRPRAAHVSATRALATVETQAHLGSARAHALLELAETSLELGRWQDAREAMRRAVAEYRQLDDPWAHGSALFGLVNICAGMGQAAEAIAAGRELVDLSSGLGLDPRSDYGVWHRVSLARGHLAAGDPAAAREAVAEVIGASPQAIRPHVALLQLRGLLALAEGLPRDAIKPLTGAVELYAWRPEPRDVGAALWLAIAAARAGEPAIAARALAAGRATLAGTDMQRFDALAGLAAFEVTGDPGALEGARAAVTRQAARFTDPELRHAFEHGVPLHQEIRDAARRATARATHRVRLARADVPLGRPVRDDELVEVDWTIGGAGPGPNALPGDRRSEPRRRVLASLMDQARAAGALPTDEQLAAALGVSRRTVLRDIEALATNGVPIFTRRRA